MIRRLLGDNPMLSPLRSAWSKARGNQASCPCRLQQRKMFFLQVRVPSAIICGHVSAKCQCEVTCCVVDIEWLQQRHVRTKQRQTVLIAKRRAALRGRKVRGVCRLSTYLYSGGIKADLRTSSCCGSLWALRTPRY